MEKLFKRTGYNYFVERELILLVVNTLFRWGGVFNYTGLSTLVLWVFK